MPYVAFSFLDRILWLSSAGTAEAHTSFFFAALTIVVDRGALEKRREARGEILACALMILAVRKTIVKLGMKIVEVRTKYPNDVVQNPKSGARAADHHSSETNSHLTTYS